MRPMFYVTDVCVMSIFFQFQVKHQLITSDTHCCISDKSQINPDIKRNIQKFTKKVGLGGRILPVL